jgi:hypothetical protein
MTWSLLDASRSDPEILRPQRQSRSEPRVPEDQSGGDQDAHERAESGAGCCAADFACSHRYRATGWNQPQPQPRDLAPRRSSNTDLRRRRSRFLQLGLQMTPGGDSAVALCDLAAEPLSPRDRRVT